MATHVSNHDTFPFYDDPFDSDEPTAAERAEALRDRGLDDIEDYYLAADVLERVRKGRERVHGTGEVRSELGVTRH